MLHFLRIPLVRGTASGATKEKLAITPQLPPPPSVSLTKPSITVAYNIY